MTKHSKEQLHFMTWQKKLGFFFLWTLSHGVSGALALILAESAVWGTKSLGGFSSVVGVIVFEGVILFFKEMVFRRFREMKLAHSVDLLAWILAGLILMLSRGLGDQPYDEEFTPISLDLLRFSIFFAISLVLITYVPGIFKSWLQKTRSWRNRFDAYLLDRPLLGISRYPVYVLTGLFFFIVLMVVLAIYFLMLFFVSIAPIEFFKMEFETLSWPVKSVWFGLSSVGYAGFLTGAFYLVLFPIQKTITDFLTAQAAGER